MFIANPSLLGRKYFLQNPEVIYTIQMIYTNGDTVWVLGETPLNYGSNMGQHNITEIHFLD